MCKGILIILVTFTANTDEHYWFIKLKELAF